MARVKKNAIHGVAGQLVYRTVNGKVIASAKPSKYKKSKSRALLSNRKKFLHASSLASYINSVPILNTVWKQFLNKESTLYNSVISKNINLATREGLTTENIIVPPSGYSMIRDISLNNNAINISFELFEKFDTLVLDRQLRIYILFAGVNYSGNMSFGDVSSNLIPEDGNGVLTSNIGLNTGIEHLFSITKNIIVYAALIWNLKDNYEFCWSSSFAKTI
jgi:hypothetical protein